MESYKFLMDIALILLSTKLLGMLTRKFHMPQVVGALLAGLILGPAMLNILNETELIKQVAELGVIVLMFTAGLETNIGELKKAGKASFVIALFGVIVPLIGGVLVASFFNHDGMTGIDSSVFLQNVFIGIILTATSVSITVETLKELGKLSTNAGNAILGAALIDDILGIIGLTVIISISGADVNIYLVLAKLLLFFIFAAAVGYLAYHAFKRWMGLYKKDLRRFPIISFVFCLLLAYASEEFFGVADITGAFLAGLILSGTQRSHYIDSRIGILSYLLLSPIFFASIGISVTLPKMTLHMVLFTVILLIVAVITKIVGCGLGAKLCKYTNRESMQVGIGMISRGEVALIVAGRGLSAGLMSSEFMTAVVIVVVITSVITPILLKVVFHIKDAAVEPSHVKSDLLKEYEEFMAIEIVEQQLEKLKEEYKKTRENSEVVKE